MKEVHNIYELQSRKNNFQTFRTVRDSLSRSKSRLKPAFLKKEILFLKNWFMAKYEQE